jgi:hypothetical protein
LDRIDSRRLLKESVDVLQKCFQVEIHL